MFAFAANRLVLLPSLLFAACGQDPIGPEDLAGQYTAVIFGILTNQPGGDVLAAGGSLTITLTASGSTTGRLVVPAALNGGTALDASMDGTFTYSGGFVTFRQTADTFMRNMPFRWSRDGLSGDKSFGTHRIFLILRR